MMDTKTFPTRLLWVDLEMTGLDPMKDLILEVSAVVTDFNFQPLGQYDAFVQQPIELLQTRMQENTWWESYPQTREALLQGSSTGKPSAVVEQELVQLVQTHQSDSPMVLAGNSIHNDRNFIKQWWPAFDGALHYRMLDVSAWKLIFQGKYGVNFEKPEVHRAHDDIEASIAELKYYLDWFKTNS